MKKILSLLIMFLLCQYSMGSLVDAYKITVTELPTGGIGHSAELTLSMSNRNAIACWKCTLVLPEGVTFSNVRTSGNRYPEGYEFELITTQQEDGSVTIICMGKNGIPLTNTEGEIATVSVSIDCSVVPGDYTVITKDAVLQEIGGTSHSNAKEYSSSWLIERIPTYYTEQLINTINGESSTSQNKSIGIVDNYNGTINFLLKNYIINGTESEIMPIGNIIVENIPVYEGDGGLQYFTFDGPITIQAGDMEGVDMWFGPMLGEIPLTLSGKMNDEKLFATIVLNMPATLGQTLNVQLGVDDFDYTLTYIVDGETYKTYTIAGGTTLTPEAAPTKEGHTFSGWSEIPETMPTKDTTITGSFTVNKYNLTYKVDGKTYKTEQVNYGTSLNGPTPVKKGMTFSGWKGLPETMPAKDVTVTGTFSWSKLTIDKVIYQVTDTLNNYASVIGNNSISGDVNILPSIETGGDTYAVTVIGEEAFDYRSSLTTVAIPNSVTTIGDRAFRSCRELTSIIIPESVTHISHVAFWGCGGLETIVVEAGNSTYDSRDNCNAIIETATNKLVRGGVNTIIPNSVTSIGASAFNLCYKMNSITIPENVSNIESHAFYECTGLTHITILGSITNIGMNTFYSCKKLKTIIIPNGVKNIGNGAFSQCARLTSISLPGSLTSIEDYAFSGCSKLTYVKVDNPSPVTINYGTLPSEISNSVLFVPAGSKSSYIKASYWKNFKQIVEHIEGDVNVDEEVDVVDVVDIARFVVGTPAESFVEILADINKDSEVNLGDAVTLVNDIAGDQNFVKAWNAPSQTIANDVLYMSDSNGTLSLKLENEREYTAFQFDLFVPEGAEVSQMMLNAERKQGHQLLYNKVEEGHYRVAALSTTNHTFNGNMGELLNITISGVPGDEVRLRNIRFFDAEGRGYVLENAESAIPTGIESLAPAFSQGEETIYDLQGRRQRKLQHGINIVGGKKIIY